MKVKLQSKKEIEIKDLTVDERDELLDNVVTETDGESVKIKAMHSTMTKFIRIGVKGADDKFIKSLVYQHIKFDTWIRVNSSFFHSFLKSRSISETTTSQKRVLSGSTCFLTENSQI